MQPMITLAPLIISLETWCLRQAQRERLTSKQRDNTQKWLQWHFGSFAKYELAAPLAVSLTRLAEDLLTPQELREHLESTRAGVAAWIFHATMTDGVGVNWSYAQESHVRPSRGLVAIQIEGTSADAI